MTLHWLGKLQESFLRLESYPSPLFSSRKKLSERGLPNSGCKASKPFARALATFKAASLTVWSRRDSNHLGTAPSGRSRVFSDSARAMLPFTLGRTASTRSYIRLTSVTASLAVGRASSKSSTSRSAATAAVSTSFAATRNNATANKFARISSNATSPLVLAPVSPDTSSCAVSVRPRRQTKKRPMGRPSHRR
jgi:hypothetical protein